MRACICDKHHDADTCVCVYIYIYIYIYSITCIRTGSRMHMPHMRAQTQTRKRTQTQIRARTQTHTKAWSPKRPTRGSSSCTRTRGRKLTSILCRLVFHSFRVIATRFFLNRLKAFSHCRAPGTVRANLASHHNRRQDQWCVPLLTKNSTHAKETRKRWPNKANQRSHVHTHTHIRAPESGRAARGEPRGDA